MYYAAYGLLADEDCMNEVCEDAKKIDFGWIPYLKPIFTPEINAIKTSTYKNILPIVIWDVRADDLPKIEAFENKNTKHVSCEMDVFLKEPLRCHINPWENTLSKEGLKSVKAVVYLPENQEMTLEMNPRVPSLDYYNRIHDVFKSCEWYADEIENAFLDALEINTKKHRIPTKRDYYCRACGENVATCTCHKKYDYTAFREVELQPFCEELFNKDYLLLKSHLAVSPKDYTYMVIAPYVDEYKDRFVPEGFELVPIDTNPEMYSCFLLIRPPKDDDTEQDGDFQADLAGVIENLNEWATNVCPMNEVFVCTCADDEYSTWVKRWATWDQV